MKNFYISILTVILVGINLFDAGAEEKTVTVSGNITNTEGAPLENASLVILNNSDTIYEISTDAQGYYEFEVLVDFVSNIKIPGYQPDYGVSMIIPNPVNSFNEPVIYYRSPNPQANPALEVFDLSGRILSPPYRLNAGTYFYRLVFEKNITTQTRPFTVSEPAVLNFTLLPENTPASPVAVQLKSLFLEEPIEGNSVSFIVEKSEYESYYDTIVLVEEQVSNDISLSKASVPIASFEVIGDLVVGKPVVFDGTSSLGSYDETLSYEWKIDGQNQGGFPKASKIFMYEGSVDVSLSVYGKFGTHTQIQETYTIDPPASTGKGAEVLGRVYTIDGMPLDSAEITVFGEDTIYISNRDGEVGIGDVATGTLVPLTITKNGYASQYVKLQIPPADTQAYFETYLIERQASMTLDAIENGGTLAGKNGTKVTLPPGSMEFEDGSTADGAIEISMTPVDVSDSLQYYAFPGSFTGLTPEGMADLILSYGTSEYHFEQDGKKLSLKDGQSATIELPVFFTKSLDGEDLMAGDSIPLWSLDPQTAIWMMEDYGELVVSEESPTGLAFKAEVSHFSWWNCDIAPNPYVPEIVPQIGSSGGNGGGGPEPGTPVSASLFGIPMGSGGGPVGTPRNEFVPEGGSLLPLPPNQDVRLEAHGNNGLLKGTKDVNGGAGQTGTVFIDMYPVSGAEGNNLIQADTLFDAAIDPVGDKDLFVFVADSGFTYNITVSRTSGSSLTGTVNLRDPDNLPLFSKDFTGNPGFIAFNSYKKGKYYIVVDGTENEPGAYTLALRKLNQIAMNSFFTDDLLGAGDRRQYAFEAQKDQLINISYLAKSISGRIYLRLYDTEGKELNDRRHQGYAETGVIRIPSSGTYMTEVYAVDASTKGEFYLGLSEVDPPLSIEPETPWKSIEDSMSILSERRYYSFEAERGEVFNMALSTEDSITAYARLYKAGDEFFDIDRKIYEVRTTNYNASYQQAEPSRLASLPESGTYYIDVQPWGNQLTNFNGKFKVTLFNPEKRPLDLNTEVQDSIKESFHFHKYQLNIPEKQAVVVRSINENFSSYLYTSLFDTSASRNAVASGRVNTFYGSAVFELPPVILQGDYILEQNPTGSSHGTYTFKAITLDDPVEITSSAPYTEVEGIIDEVGERDYYRFSGDSGQIVSLDLIVPDTSNLRGSVRLYAAGEDFVSGQTLRDDFYNAAQADISPGSTGGITLELPYDTTYIIEVDGISTLIENSGYGNYILRFNAIEKAMEIHVDDDNADYASAVTGFVRSASRAVLENGTITVHPGDYSESLEVKIISNGVTLMGTNAANTIISSSAHSTVSIEAKKPVIENIQIDPAQYRAVLGHRNGDSTIIRNSIIRGGGDGLEFTNADYVQIYDNVIDVSTGGPAVEITGEHTLFSNNSVNVDEAYTANTGLTLRGNQLIVENNTIGNPSVRNISFTALNLRSDTATITGNVVNNYITGISVYPVDDNLWGYIEISDNVLGNVTGSNGGNSDGIRINNIDSVVIRNNFIKGGPDLSRGINVYNSGGIVANNRISVNRFRSFYYDYTENEASTVLIVVNNTFVNTGTYPYNGGTYFSSSEATVNVRLLNNIISAPDENSTNYCAIDADKPMLLVDYNMIDGFGADYCGSAVAGANDLYADPLLNYTDLTLTVTSPAKDAGTTDYAPATDFEGDAREDGSIDIGADEL